MTRDRRAQKRVVLYRARVPDEEELYEVAYESVADALHFACRDLRTERRKPLAIVEDGIVVMDAARIEAECRDLPEGLSLEPRD
jgi:hypothetical protein